jgi:hypothetical protein
MIPYITFDDFIVFLEGLQVPVSAIDLTYGNGTSSCKISIVPNTFSKQIWPLTRVHIFYKFQNKYRLLFDGRVIDVSYSRTPQRVDTIITAVDFTYFLGIIPLFFYTFDPNTPFLQIALGKEPTISVPFGKFDTTFFELLSKKKTVEDILQEFFDLIYNKTKEYTVSEKKESASGKQTVETTEEPDIDRKIDELVSVWTKTELTKRPELGNLEKMTMEGLAYQYQALFVYTHRDRIKDRFSALTTSNVIDSAAEEIWKDLLQGTLTQQSSEISTIMLFIDELTRKLGMTWFTFPPGLPNPKKFMTNLFILPYLYSAKVPNCNLISEMEYCQIVRNIMQMPTRMIYILPIGNIPATEEQQGTEGAVSYRYLIYPQPLANFVAAEVKKQQGPNYTGKRQPFYQIYYRFITSEEAIRGVNNLEKEVPLKLTTTINGSNLETQKLIDQAQNFARNMLAYEYWTARYSQSNVYISMFFNPFIVPGFPAFIYDKNNEYTGRFLPLEISHSISATGISTTIRGAFYQNIEEIQKEQAGKIIDPVANYTRAICPNLVDPRKFYENHGLTYDMMYDKDNLEKFNMENLREVVSIKTWMLFAKDRKFINLEDFEKFMKIEFKTKQVGESIYCYFRDPGGASYYYHPERRKVIEKMVSEILMKKIKLG